MTVAEELEKLEEAMKKEGMAQLEKNLFQITSKSDQTKSYIIDLNDLNSHKSDCVAFRYGKECNHIKRLKKFGFMEDES